jgi:hypothetical protein
VRVAVRANRAAVLGRIAARLPPAWRPLHGAIVQRLYSFVVPPRRGVHGVCDDTGQLVVKSRRLDDVLDAFESHLHLYVAEWAPRHVFLHAGVVGWRGRAILVPGTSMSGKSTLVAELIRRGATYYSDEYAVLDARGRVHPYPRSLHLRPHAPAPANDRRGAPFPRRAGHRSLPVGLVVVTGYERDARWRPRPLPSARGALALLDHAVAARHAPERVLAAIGEVARQARFLASRRGEAAEIASLILARG